MSGAMTAAPGKSCGSCTLCCKVLRIAELEKEHGVWCKHAQPGKGCAIYDTRPRECRTFHCGYLASSELSDEWHPARSKIVLIAEAAGGVTAVVDAGRPDAWRQAPFYQQLKAWAREGVAVQRPVMVRIGARTIAVLPDREVDLGLMDPGEQVVIEAEPGPFGTVYNARKAGPQAIIAPAATPQR